jgi:hypothetical protein
LASSAELRFIERQVGTPEKAIDSLSVFPLGDPDAEPFIGVCSGSFALEAVKIPRSRSVAMPPKPDMNPRPG